MDTTSSVTSNRGTWSSKLGFVMAAAGSAVGLGNIWKFPTPQVKMAAVHSFLFIYYLLS